MNVNCDRSSSGKLGQIRTALKRIIFVDRSVFTPLVDICSGECELFGLNFDELANMRFGRMQFCGRNERVATNKRSELCYPEKVIPVRKKTSTGNVSAKFRAGFSVNLINRRKMIPAIRIMNFNSSSSSPSEIRSDLKFKS